MMSPLCIPAGSRAVSKPQLSSIPARRRRACRSALLDVFLDILNTWPLLHLPWTFRRTLWEAALEDSPASETLSSYAFQRVAIWLLYQQQQPSYPSVPFVTALSPLYWPIFSISL